MNKLTVTVHEATQLLPTFEFMQLRNIKTYLSTVTNLFKKKKLPINTNASNCINLLLAVVSESTFNNEDKVRKFLRDEHYDFEITFNLTRN